MNAAILLSGGVGSRIASDIPKQYVRLNGHMMITYSLHTLLQCEYVDEVYIVADEAWRDEISADVADVKIKDFAKPGTNRQASIFSGMETIISNHDEAGDDDTVLVHDAARPFLTVSMLDECYKALSGHDGVMPVLPMKDTVYYSEDGSNISKLLDRSKIFAGQAPELFRLRKYYEANKALLPDKINEINGASEPAVMYGMDIAMISGDEANYKVTTDEDMRRVYESMAT